MQQPIRRRPGQIIFVDPAGLWPNDDLYKAINPVIYTKPEMVLMAERAAMEADIRPDLLCALIEISSSWFADKAEAQSYYVPPINQWDSIDIDETAFRNYRWGLTQVLGSAARDAGYKAPLNQLIQPPDNVSVGARALARAIRSAGGHIDKGLGVWYGVPGSNFPARVINLMPKYFEFLGAPKRPAPLKILGPPWPWDKPSEMETPDEKH